MLLIQTMTMKHFSWLQETQIISACNARDCYGILLKNKGGAVSASENEPNREDRDEGG